MVDERLAAPLAHVLACTALFESGARAISRRSVGGGSGAGVDLAADFGNVSAGGFDGGGRRHKCGGDISEIKESIWEPIARGAGGCDQTSL